MLLLSLLLVLLLVMLMSVVWLLLLLLYLLLLLGAGEPLLVRLSKGEVVTALEADLTAVLRRIRLGAALDVGACVTLLLMVAIDVVLSFSHYERCPYIASQLCRSFNDHWRVSCLKFLAVPDSDLDLGLSLPLKRLALAAGGDELAQTQFQMSDVVQEALASTFATACASSLPVERKFAEAKRNEAPRLCSVAVASRSQLLRHFHRDRTVLLQKVKEASEGLRRARKTNVQSVAWLRRPALVGQSLGVCAREGERRDELVRRHQAEQMRAFVEENRSLLEHDVVAAREHAEAAVRSAQVSMPLTQAEWARRIASSKALCTERMKAAPDLRRLLPKRLREAEGTPAPSPRLGPEKMAARAPQSGSGGWVELLWGRSGWFALRTRKGPVTVLLAHLRGETWALSMDCWKVGAARFHLGARSVRLRGRVLPLAQLAVGAEVIDVFELCIAGKSLDKGVELSVAHASAVSGPLPRLQRRRAPRKDGGTIVGGEGNSDTEAECERAEGDAASAISESSGCSVDTDIDSEVDMEAKAAARALEKNLHGALDRLAAPALDAPTPSGDCDLGEESEAIAGADGVERGPRSAPGTWTVWSSPWLYISQTPGWTDMKCSMYGSFRNVTTGMGTSALSKTLTPWHYGDTMDDPWRTLILLKAWALWRARYHGWVAARECRVREADMQSKSLIAQLRSAHGGVAVMPLLGSDKASRLLETWVPLEVTAAKSA